MVLFPMLDVFVRVLDHDDGSVDHRADCDGDAAQGHDVRIDPLETHHDKGRQHPQWKRDDSHQC